MSDDVRTRLQIKGGRELVERAESLKARGVIEDYVQVVSNRDSRIVDHVTLVPKMIGRIATD